MAESFTLQTQGVHRSAVFSPCGRYRYALSREWGFGRGRVLYVGANPSRAGDAADDNTCSKLIALGQRWGFAALDIANPLAWVATHPRELRCVTDPVGIDNEFWLNKLARKADKIVVGWGDVVPKKWARQLEGTLEILRAGHARELWCFGVTEKGNPRHVLYQPYARELEVFLG